MDTRFCSTKLSGQEVSHLIFGGPPRKDGEPVDYCPIKRRSNGQRSELVPRIVGVTLPLGNDLVFAKKLFCGFGEDLPILHSAATVFAT